ncbi:MAG TPA: aminodeoxychorismate/anthranilate synthase component II [Verrucomicrobiae bacterium]|jgi:anthranilate synthase/aminodeoxychorismate synthase-like glutamine amidotransferase|nr:aminodeoxychorismate/anthranilate synthase component II [Verrucomicrobiae bacterium]
MILVIDNYDSFVHNLARYLRELGWSTQVVRNDGFTLDEIAALKPSHIVISPGPCTPNEAGISVATVRRFGPSIPILGVCLGHQSIGQAFGGRIVRARRPMHGKTSMIRHGGGGIFAGLPIPLRATRYHSLVVAKEDLPEDLVITAESQEGEIMALAHRRYPIVGLQFHPEAVLTEHGYDLLRNFLGRSVTDQRAAE